jgi:hypothetical protein
MEKAHNQNNVDAHSCKNCQRFVTNECLKLHQNSYDMQVLKATACAAVTKTTDTAMSKCMATLTTLLFLYVFDCG